MEDGIILQKMVQLQQEKLEINGQKLYFDNPWGFQTKGRVADNGKFYDKDSGELVTNTFREGLTSVGKIPYMAKLYMQRTGITLIGKADH